MIPNHCKQLSHNLYSNLLLSTIDSSLIFKATKILSGFRTIVIGKICTLFDISCNISVDWLINCRKQIPCYRNNYTSDWISIFKLIGLNLNFGLTMAKISKHIQSNEVLERSKYFNEHFLQNLYKKYEIHILSFNYSAYSRLIWIYSAPSDASMLQVI